MSPVLSQGGLAETRRKNFFYLRILERGRHNVHLALLGKVEEFLLIEILQLLALGVEFLVELDALFLHLPVGVIGAAYEMEIISARNAKLTVFAVQPNPQQPGFTFTANHWIAPVLPDDILPYSVVPGERNCHPPACPA
jgi:hypothetical protein